SYESNIGSGNETAIGSGNETNTDLFSDNVTGIETDTDIASNNDTLAALDAFLSAAATPAGTATVTAGPRAYRSTTPRQEGHHDTAGQHGDPRADRPRQQDRAGPGPRRPDRPAGAGQVTTSGPPDPGGDRRPAQTGQEPAAQFTAEHAGRARRRRRVDG